MKTLFDQVRKVYPNPNTTVMGPEYEHQLQELTHNDKLRKQIAKAAAQDDPAKLHDPFAKQPQIEEPQTETPKRIDVFKRMGEANMTEKQTKKKAKHNEFIQSLCQYTQ